MPNQSPFLLDAEVEEIVLLSGVTRWRQEKLGRFPKRIKIANRKIAYKKSDVEDWCQDPDGWRARNASQGEAN